MDDQDGALYLVHQIRRIRRRITRTEAIRWIIENYIPAGFERDFEKAIDVNSTECPAFQSLQPPPNELPTLSELLLGDDLTSKVGRIALAEHVAIHDLLLFAMFRKLAQLGVRIEESWVMNELAAFRTMLANQRGAER